MAQKRMFSLKVIDTDLFLEMPQSTRLLYYELCMRADDDGFVASPRKIMKMTGCSEDDFKILMSKQYIIPFESGVCVIKHWRVHNIIQKDRYTETEYKREKSILMQKDNKYEVMETLCIQNDSIMETQIRLDKNSIDKISKDKKEGQKKKTSKIKYADFVTMTEEEYKKLIEQFQEKGTSERIENLNLYKGSTGKTYLNDYLTILSWDRRNKDKSVQQSTSKIINPTYNQGSKRKYDDDKLESLLLNK